LTSLEEENKALKRDIATLKQSVIECKRVEEELRESEAKYRTLFDSMSEGYALSELIWDDKERPSNYLALDVNPVVEKILGLPRSMIVGHRISEIFPKMRPPLIQFGEMIRTGKPIHFEEYSPTLQKWFDVYAFPVLPGDRFAQIFSDITERKRVELELKEYAENLKRSNKDLERFAYVSSHDLKEPLRAIVSFSQILEQEYRGKLGEKGDRYIRNIVEAGNRMNSLIDDLLKYSYLATHEIRQTQTFSQLVLDETIAVLGPQIEGAGAVITHDPLPSVRIDRSLLGMIFQNLICNALKFRKEDTPPQIHISAQPRDGMVQFSVSDNGIGIEPEYIQKLFVIFERLHRRDRYAGTGIGLALLKRIIERHGGKIWVESVEGEGSTFFFTVPDANDSNHV
jgi:signal transduction histidine kinase